MSDRDTHHAWAESVLALPYETLAARPFLLRDALIDAHADRAALRAERDATLRGLAQLREALVQIQETHDGYPLSDAEVIRKTYAIADAALAQAEDYRANAEAVIIPLNVELAAALRGLARLREALTIAAEKVGILYAMYSAGTAFWTEGTGIIVDAGWEARLIEADAVLSRALTATATDTHEP
jgi:hypothetical protein